MTLKYLAATLRGFLLSTFLLNAFLHSQEHQDPQSNEIKIHVAPIDNTAQPLSESELKELMHEAHEHLEGAGDDEEKSTLRKIFTLSEWTEKLNFKGIALKGARWYQSKAEDPRTRVHAANILTMLLTSHSIEVFGGSNAIAGTFDIGNAIVDKIVPVMGGVIMLPGLDPLCIALITTYSLMPNAMGKLVYYPRILIVETSAFLYQSLGLRALIQYAFSQRDAVERLERSLAKKSGASEIVRLENKVHLKIGSAQNAKLIELKGTLRDGKIIWEKVNLHHDLQNIVQRRIALDKIKGLNFVLRESLKQMMEAALDPSSLAKIPYIEKAEETYKDVRIQINSTALATVPTVKLSNASKLYIAKARRLHKSAVSCHIVLK